MRCARKTNCPLRATSPSLLAITKATEISTAEPDALIIGADQMLAFEDRTLEKPADFDMARNQLLDLRGKTHVLHSAVCLCRGGQHLWSHVDTATMTMRAFSPEFVGRYLSLAGAAVLTSVGAYQLEGPGARNSSSALTAIISPCSGFLCCHCSQSCARWRSCLSEVKQNLPHACVIGWPVAHSRSPLIHGYWLETYGLPGHYDKQAVPPEDLPAFLDSFAARGFIGANVTVPHKELAHELVDLREPAADAVQAVNTIWLDGAACWRQHGCLWVSGEPR